MLTCKQGVDVFRVTDRLSESDRAAMMGETLMRIYDWPKTQASDRAILCQEEPALHNLRSALAAAN
jgi:hypothetical protein